MTAGKNTHSEIGATAFEGRSSVETSTLEPKTLDFFLYIAGEAVHWDWTPPIEGLYQFTNEQKGRFTHLKRCGLFVVEEIDDDSSQKRALPLPRSTGSESSRGAETTESA